MGEAAMSKDEFDNDSFRGHAAFAYRAKRLGADYLDFMLGMVSDDMADEVIDWCRDEVMTEDQVYEYMDITSKMNSEKKLRYINNILDEAQREQFAKDIYKVFLNL